jgi:hypothetical protein
MPKVMEMEVLDLHLLLGAIERLTQGNLADRFALPGED